MTDPQAVAKAADLGGQSMFLVDTTGAATAVAKLPAVKAAGPKTKEPNLLQAFFEP